MGKSRAKVVPGSPAEKAGVQAGDVILRFNDTPLAVSGELPPLVGSVDPGTVATLQLLRAGKQIKLKVELEELSETEAGVSPLHLPLGLDVAALSAAERAEAKLGEGGVRVVAAAPGPAQKAGVQAGDILLSLAGEPIDSPRKFKDAVVTLKPGSSVPLLIQRGGAPLFLALEVPAASDKP